MCNVGDFCSAPAKKPPKKSKKGICRCCSRNKSSSSSYDLSDINIDLNREHDFYLENLVVHKAPLSLAGTREDIKNLIRKKTQCFAQNLPYVEHAPPKRATNLSQPEQSQFYPPRLVVSRAVQFTPQEDQYPPQQEQFSSEEDLYQPQGVYRLPQQIQYPPQQVQFPPQQVQFPPQQVQYPPQQVQCPPQQVQYPPKQKQFSPQEVQYPPQHRHFPPKLMLYSPQKMRYVPKQLQYPPQQVQYPPRQVQYPPQQVQYPPQQVQYPSQQVQYPPQQVQYPPQQVQYPPQREQCAFQQLKNAPQKSVTSKVQSFEPKSSKRMSRPSEKNATVQTYSGGGCPGIVQRPVSTSSYRPSGRGRFSPKPKSYKHTPISQNTAHVPRKNVCDEPPKEENRMGIFERSSRNKNDMDTSCCSICHAEDLKYRLRRGETCVYPVTFTTMFSPFMRNKDAQLEKRRDILNPALCNNTSFLSSGDASMISSQKLCPHRILKDEYRNIGTISQVHQGNYLTPDISRPFPRSRHCTKMCVASDQQIPKPKETRFKPEPEERTFIVSASEHNATPQNAAASGSKIVNDVNKKKSKERLTPQQPKEKNEAGPSRSAPTTTRSQKTTLKEPKEVTSSASLISVITKASLKSASFAANRDVLEDENKPIPGDNPQPGKPLFVNVSGRSLTKKETNQILNKYSSIFVENIKDPIPKDPLRPDASNEAGPSHLNRAIDLATQLSQIGSTQFRQVSNSVYASPQSQRPINESQSVESVVERIHQYDVESTISRSSEEEISSKLINTKWDSKTKGSKNRTSKSGSPKPGTSKVEPSKRDASKPDSLKFNSKVATLKSENQKQEKQRESQKQKSTKSGPQNKEPSYQAQFFEILNVHGRCEELEKDSGYTRPVSTPMSDRRTTRHEQSPRPVSSTRPVRYVPTHMVSRKDSRSEPQRTVATSANESSLEKIERQPKDYRVITPAKYQSDSRQSCSPIRSPLNASRPHSSNRGEYSVEKDRRFAMVVDAHISPPKREGEEKKRWKIVIKHKNDSSTEDSQHG